MKKLLKRHRKMVKAARRRKVKLIDSVDMSKEAFQAAKDTLKCEPASFGQPELHYAEVPIRVAVSDNEIKTAM
jgi:hypothetical protein